MNIQEATKLAIKQNRYISRVHFIKTFKVKLKPTNTYDLCKTYCLNPGEVEPRRAWSPRADDLIADDWIVID
ncbi:TPA: Thoeris anti-defense Tad2 family protein [Bacillus cereus]